jgi:abortive infection bacteriophage resistance protein
MIPNRMNNPWITLPTDKLRIYFDLCIIKYFVDAISPGNDMKQKIVALLTDFPEIDIAAMGFPADWQAEPLWQ